MLEYIKAKNWNGEDLTGVWDFSIKIDGVRAIRTEDGWVSRNNKPLYNLEHLPKHLTDVEIFKNDWSTTISMVRTKDAKPVHPKYAHSLYPIDSSLLLADGPFTDPTKEFIEFVLRRTLVSGYEGLVLRQGDTWLKVKPVETYDVKVIGAKEGKGKNANKLGAFLTDMGNVGTGFTDKQRQDYWRRYQHLNEDITIEVECMELTPDGKFRHPRFVRVRWDK